MAAWGGTLRVTQQREQGGRAARQTPPAVATDNNTCSSPRRGHVPLQTEDHRQGSWTGWCLALIRRESQREARQGFAVLNERCPQTRKGGRNDSGPAGAVPLVSVDGISSECSARLEKRCLWKEYCGRHSPVGGSVGGDAGSKQAAASCPLMQR